MSRAKYIDDIADIPHREAIILTGGEPLEHPKLLDLAIFRARTLRFNKVYLYTARYTPRFEEFVKRVDGVHYTLHEHPTERDIADFQKVQEIFARNQTGKTFRAFLSPTIAKPVSIIPNVWLRVEVKPLTPETEVCLPKTEELFIIKNKVQDVATR